ncbi:hypothetical protein TNCT_204781 [Trichonephila clavata]|uniref:Uncharacterized protein n=1 Tax=Trichonephila clavata TaxID=2740835 RepID=A0A8X6JK24_TRICU|nr:hypothetical protein TNCT_204781 [Trichonephila clavata]
MVSQSDSSSDMELRTFTRQISNLSSTKVTMRTTSQRQDPSGANETNQDTQAGYHKRAQVLPRPRRWSLLPECRGGASGNRELPVNSVQLSPNRYSALTNNSSQQENPDSRAPKPNAPRLPTPPPAPPPHLTRT